MKRTKRAFVPSVSGYVSISAFASIIGVPKFIVSSAVGLRICAITAAVKKYQSIVKEKRKMHNKIVLLIKTKLNTMKALIRSTHILIITILFQ